MKTLLALVFFPIIFVLIGTIGFMYAIGGLIATVVIAAINLKNKKEKKLYET